MMTVMEKTLFKYKLVFILHSEVGHVTPVDTVNF
jgi:hypothetical protein